MRRIVVVGAGFAGLHIATELADALESRRGLRLTVVTDRAHFLFTPLWGGVAAGTSKLGQIAMPLDSLLPPHVQLFVERVREVDLAERVIHTGQRTIDYDHLVLAPGAVPKWGGLESLEQHALPCTTGRDAVDVHDAITRAFRDASLTQDSAERRRLLTFVVVGAGLCGVELAAQIASRVEQQTGVDFPSALAAEMRLILVERERQLVPEVDEVVRMHVREHLIGQGVDIRLGEAVVACDGHRVEFAGGDAVGCGTIFWCGGVRAPSWLSEAGLEVDEDGRVAVHRSLQAVGHHGVYVAGDVSGTGAPMTAEAAVQQAGTVARNIIADLAGRSRRDWSYEAGGTFVQLGRTNAVASYKGVVLVGRSAQALCGAMTTKLLPPGLRGLKLVPDLFAGAFAARSSNAAKLLPE